MSEWTAALTISVKVYFSVPVCGAPPPRMLAWRRLIGDRLDGNRIAGGLSSIAAGNTLICGACDDILHGGLGLDQLHFGDDSGPIVMVDGPHKVRCLHISCDVFDTGGTTATDLLARLLDNQAGHAVLDHSRVHRVTFLH